MLVGLIDGGIVGTHLSPIPPPPNTKQVGAMVAIVRAVLAAGHAKPYRPIDLKLLPPNLPYPRVEPGRVEVRTWRVVLHACRVLVGEGKREDKSLTKN